MSTIALTNSHTNDADAVFFPTGNNEEQSTGCNNVPVTYWQYFHKILHLDDFDGKVQSSKSPISSSNSGNTRSSFSL